jgi:hypothetical protein
MTVSPRRCAAVVPTIAAISTLALSGAASAHVSRGALAGTANAFPNPYGCYGRADYPHLSNHYPGTVAATGRTICATGGLYLKVTAKLARQDCLFGAWPCWWTYLDTAVGTSPRTLSDNAVATASANCSRSGSHLYAFVINSEVWDSHNRYYSGTTGRQAQVDCG